MELWIQYVPALHAGIVGCNYLKAKGSVSWNGIQETKGFWFRFMASRQKAFEAQSENGGYPRN